MFFFVENASQPADMAWKKMDDTCSDHSVCNETQTATSSMLPSTGTA